MSGSPSPPETPRSEPEIIPPDRPGYGRVRWDSVDQYGQHRIYVRRIGPFSIFGFVLVFGFVVAALLALLLGAVLVALPIAALLLAGGLIASLLRPRLPH
jgi:hypothetical protein